MSTVPVTTVELQCDVTDCRSKINVGQRTNEKARNISQDAGWRVRVSNLVTADFCPTHAAHVDRSERVDDLRVWRNPFGDLFYWWPSAAPGQMYYPRLHPTDSDQPRHDWVELVPVGSILQRHDAEIEEVRADLDAAARVATAYAQDPFPTSLRSRHPELAAALDALLEHRLGR